MAVETSTVRSTDLRRCTYQQLGLHQPFTRRTGYQRISADAAHLKEYDQHGDGAAYVTTGAHQRVVSLKLLNQVSRQQIRFDNGLMLGMPFGRVRRLLGRAYVTFDTERYGRVAEYVDKRRHAKLLLGLSSADRVTAIVLFDPGQYDYQY
ncbi:hypothetical protein D1831_11015 [Lactiplantibacillus garii]|uniref:Uncharacterized protein n=1 Tax=Lactiplantibacillus garii TaxID=2306423 RepID=A0A426D5V4_9LACO|nr:hypothetical protein [Lactiplantibacillus garii]RRK09779.1 hypothetical protein D1831_11015 [Lactiplantibacillus garii]